jgi:aminopeptidase N
VVGDDQAREPWLDEGLARFNEVRYDEAYSPQDVEWWWETIILPNKPTAPLNSAVYEFHDHGSYLNSVYDQGATFLNTLRSEMGADAFNSFLHDLYYRESFRLMTTQDFLAVLKEHTSIDLAPLTRRFFK